MVSLGRFCKKAADAGKEKSMNVRKPVDYSTMFTALDALMAASLPQLELYCEIGCTQNVVIL